MPRRAANPPPLEDWLSRTDRRSADQYASALRPLLREVSAADATTDDLVRFVLTLRAIGSQKRAVSAIVAFFGDLVERGVIDRDPSHRLADRVREASGRRRRADALSALGLPPSQPVTWRSVADRLVRQRAGGHALTALPDAPVVEQMEKELLRRLGGMTHERFDSLMDASVT
jgi:hypothetical protein